MESLTELFTVFFGVWFVELQVQFRYFLPQLGVPQLLEDAVRIPMNVPSVMETEVYPTAS